MSTTSSQLRDFKEHQKTMDRLQASISAHQSGVTRASDKLRGELSNETPESTRVEILLDELDKRVEKLEKIWDELDVELELSECTEKAERARSEMETFLSQALELKLEAKKRIAASETKPSNIVVFEPTSTESLKQKYNGNPVDYQSFIDNFERIVGKSKRDNASKLSLLLDALVGEAKMAMKAWKATDEGYEEALKYFKTRFGNIDKRRHALLQKLEQLESIQEDDSTRLRAMLDEKSGIVRALSQLGMDSDRYSATLNRKILMCMPQRTQEAWYLTPHTSDDPKLEELLEFLERQATAWERTAELRAATTNMSIGEAAKATATENSGESGDKCQR